MITDKYSEMDFQQVENEIYEICEYIKADDYDGAREILDELIVTSAGIYGEDDKERYFCFDSPLHFYLYDFKLSPKKLIKRSVIDYRTLYLCSAHIYSAYEEYEKAEEELRNALYWNPVDFNVFSELASLYLKLNDDSKFLIVANAMRSYILSKEMLSEYHLRLASYYLNKKDYTTAAALFYASEYTGSTSASEDGINKIIEITGQTPVAPGIEELKETLIKDNLEYGLDPEILSLIYDLSFDLQNRGNKDGAKYCLEVLFDLTDDEKYMREIEFMESHEE